MATPGQISDFDLIKTGVQLSAFIKSTIPGVIMKSSGRGKFMMKCCFHQDNSPSLSIDDTIGAWYCFGCGKGGSIIDFQMERSGSDDTLEALKAISQSSGIQLQERVGSGPSRRDVMDALTFVAREANSHLLKGDPEYDENLRGVRSYLKDRGITKKIAEDWWLGYIPSNEWILDLDVDHSLLESCKFLNAQKRSNFVRRLLFPLMARGKALGFGARLVPGIEGVLDGKYLNPINGHIYNKQRDSYRRHFPERQPEYTFVVEGYFDVLGLVSFGGVQEALACCGTAFTKEHLNTIQSTRSTPVFVFDGDEAGSKAMLRSSWVANQQEDSLVVFLDDGTDPFDLSQSHGAGVQNVLLDKAVPIAEALVLAAHKIHGESPLDFDSAVSDIVTTLRSETLRSQAVHLAARLRKIEPFTYQRNLVGGTRNSKGDDDKIEGIQVDDASISILGWLLSVEDEKLNNLIRAGAYVGDEYLTDILTSFLGLRLDGPALPAIKWALGAPGTGYREMPGVDKTIALAMASKTTDSMMSMRVRAAGKLIRAWVAYPNNAAMIHKAPLSSTLVSDWTSQMLLCKNASKQELAIQFARIMELGQYLLYFTTPE